MPPRRSGSGRRIISAYKKGDYVEYQYKGSTVTGKLCKKSPNGTNAKPIWVVTPSDRRRKNEDIPEKALGKIIDAQEASSNRGPKLRKSSRVTRDSSSPTNTSNSDGSFEDERTGKRGGGSPTGNNSKASRSTTRKRRNDSKSVEKSIKKRKTVTFTKHASKTAILKKKVSRKATKANATSNRIGTRSRGGLVQGVLLPEHPAKKKSTKGKKVNKDANVKIVKMLTGTLYMYRGERPRAEFVRFK